MNEEQELIKNFLRKWSTIEQTPITRQALIQEILTLQGIIDNQLLEEAKDKNRDWFATKYQEQ